MRGALLAASTLALAACAMPWGDFKVTGQITVAARLVEKLPRENSVLFVVAKNQGGMPVAVHRIVNPQFPVSFSLTKDDVLIPGFRPKGPFRLAVEMNTHGNVGSTAHGDFAGDYPDTVSTRQIGVHVVIDRQL